jgi:hypothetical protein
MEAQFEKMSSNVFIGGEFSSFFNKEIKNLKKKLLKKLNSTNFPNYFVKFDESLNKKKNKKKKSLMSRWSKRSPIQNCEKMVKK